MAKVETVNRDSSMLGNVVRGVALGGVTGYVSKYVLPVQKSEKESKTYQKAMQIIRRESKNLKGNAIERIRNLPDKTPAQDTFIKMVDSAADEIKNPVANKLRIMRQLKPEDKLELKNIISSVNNYATRMYKQHVTAYEVGVTKRIRPGFVGLGSVLGFAAAVAYNVMKTEVRDNVY